MTNKLDYNNEAVLQILNNPKYTDEEKKQLFEEYKKGLKKQRKNEIVNRLNGYAKDIPVITKEIYIDCLKKYENDDLTKPFEVIEEELNSFESEMRARYNSYLEEKQKAEIPVQEAAPVIDETEDEIVPDVTPIVEPEKLEEFDDTLFKDPNEFAEKMEDVKPTLFIKDEISVLNEEPESQNNTLFDEENKNTKEVMPEELPDSLDEKGNASAIILSIIALIIGVVVMYSIIRLK